MLKHVNAVIVGAGAGGGVVAKELATAGLSVVLLERGKWYSAADCRKDDLFNQRTSILGAKFGPDDERNPRVFVDDHGRESIVNPAMARTTITPPAWAAELSAMARRLAVHGERFPHALHVWRAGRQHARRLAIGYDDLEPFYQKAEWEMGVSGDDSGNIFKAPRRKSLPMPPLPPGKEHAILEPAARRLGLHPFHIPCCGIPFPTTAAAPACAAAGAWASPAK